MSQFSSRFLQIDQPGAERIIAGFGSPLFVIDEPGIVQRLQEFIRESRALYEHSIVALSYKTNPLHGLLSKLHQQDVYAEVVSGDEYRIARALNIPGQEIVFNGPVKTDAELEQAVFEGAVINCDHADEIDRIESLAKSARRVVPIGLRLSFPGNVNWNRFGFRVVEDDPNSEAHSIARRVQQSRQLVLSGLHAQLGTNIRDLSHFHRLGQLLADFAIHLKSEYGKELDWIDVGGGLAGVSPRMEDNCTGVMALPPVRDYIRTVATPLLGYLNALRKPARLFFEPGRTLFEPFGGLLTTVVGRRPADSSGIPAVNLDAGLSALAEADRYTYPLHVCKAGAATARFHLFGPSCRERDRVLMSVAVPPLEPGDRLVIYGVGAYSMALGCSFIRFRPGVVTWEGSGEMRWLRKPENLAHVQQLEIV